MRNLLTLLLTLPGLALAHSYNGALTAALVGGTVAGVTTGTQYTIYRSLMAAELEGWKNNETGSTITLQSQCNVQAEMHLVGDHRQNFVLLGLSNTTDKTFYIRPKDIEIVFNKQSTRFPGWASEPSDLVLKPNWWQLGYIPFPSKEEFKDYDSLEIKIPIVTPKEETCVLTASFTKQKKVLKEEMSYTVMDINFEGGPSLMQNGPIKYLGKPSSIFGLGMNVFAHPNHGVGFSFFSERTFEDSKNTKIHRKFENGKNYSASTLFLGVNYAYRHFISDRWSANYEPAIGWQTIYDEDDRDRGDSQEAKSHALAVVNKVMLNWTFGRVMMPNYRGLDFTAGLGLMHTWVPSDKVGGQKLNGERLGALFRFGMGF